MLYGRRNSQRASNVLASRIRDISWLEEIRGKVTESSAGYEFGRVVTYPNCARKRRLFVQFKDGAHLKPEASRQSFRRGISFTIKSSLTGLQCHGVLIQFHEFIVSNLDSVSFERLLPPFEKIVTDYGVDPPAAFYLWRPILAEKIRQHDIDLTLELQKQKILKGLANSDKASDLRDETANPSTPTDHEMQGISQETSASTLAVSAGLEETVGVEVAAVKSDEYVT